MKVFFFLAVLGTTACYSQTTLDQFLSHPIESGFVASADGKNMAWVTNDQGKRNIVVKIGNEIPRLLTTYQQDDGQELSGLVFSPNGTILLYVRGGAANRMGQNPNPASLAEGVSMSIYFKDITSKSSLPARLTDGSSPVFFRGGLGFLFAKGGQIFESTPDINFTPKALFSARGTNTGPKVSPDGREILFTSDRGDHSFIGIFNIDKKTLRWVAPDVNRDGYPVWSPDGKQVAFIRTAGARGGELNNLTAGNRFSVWVADAETCRGRLIWQSPGDDGGFSQNYPNTPLAWTKSDRILFFSEHTGWNHLHSMTPTGSDVKDITPGNGEVENFILNLQGNAIYFDGNREDIHRRHIWKSDATTGNPQAVTTGEGIETSPYVSATGLYCYRSTANTSKALVKIDEAGRTMTPVFPQKSLVFQPGGFSKPEEVVMKSADGTAIHGQLFIDRSKQGKRPGIVFMHGGPQRQMLVGFHYGDYYIHCYAFNQYLASQGYAVLSVNFRAGTGYGRDFRRAKAQGPRGASEYQDVLTAAKHLQTLAEVDAGKIGLWGGSYGGYLTAMGLARNPEIFKAGVDIHGVHNWAFRAKEFSPGGGWGIGPDEMEIAFKSSPVADLSKWTAPVLFVHGDDDRNVLFQETTDLVERLREKNVPVETLILPDEIHGFLRYGSWYRVFESARDFFDRKLK